MRAVDHWRKVRTLTGYLAGRVQQLFDQAGVRGGRWVMDSGQTLKSAIDEEFKRYESETEEDKRWAKFFREGK